MICPFCNLALDVHVSADGREIAPKDDDVALCSACGNVCIIRGGRLHRPTAFETKVLEKSERVRAALTQRAEVEALLNRIQRKPTS